MEDPFALLGAPRRYDLDLDAVEKSHRELSRALHPDKFTQAGASERKDALGKAADVNEAWRIVRDPLRRAEALFSLAPLNIIAFDIMELSPPCDTSGISNAATWNILREMLLLSDKSRR